MLNTIIIVFLFVAFIAANLPWMSERLFGLIVVKSGVQKVAISIDEFLDQHQVVVKPLDKNFRAVEGIGAATVRGDGSIGLILDILGIINAQVKVDKGSASQRAS